MALADAYGEAGRVAPGPLFYPGGKPHGINKIVTAHATLTAGGIPVAVQNCKTECGCKLIGRANATVG